jgi:hypothetical protein
LFRDIRASGSSGSFCRAARKSEQGIVVPPVTAGDPASSSVRPWTGRNTIETEFAVHDIRFHAIGLNLPRRWTTKGQYAAKHRRKRLRTRPNPSSKKDMKALTMKFVPPDTSLKDYKTRRNAFLAEVIALTPNVSTRAKEFRRWINENSPHGDNDEA